MILKRLLFLMIVLSTETLVAASSAHGAESIPTKTIMFQALNFSITLILLHFLTRKKLMGHFEERKEKYTAQVREAESAKRTAEEKRKEISHRLQKLEANSETDLEKAKIEAKNLKAKLVTEAESLSEKLKKESERSVQFELERASAELRQELLENSVRQAKDTLEDKVEAMDLKRLQNEFVEKIQVAQ